MPKLVDNALSAIRVRNESTPGRYSDGNGLSLRVTETGSKFFEWRGTIRTVRCVIYIGPVTLVSLAEARAIAKRYRIEARNGGDPRRPKRSPLTFEKAAKQVHAEQIAGHARNAKHADQWLSSLRQHAFPTLGRLTVDTITQADVHAALLPIWTTIPETASRVRQRISSVMDWAGTKGHREAPNPVAGVERALPRQRRVRGHHASLDWHQLPALLRRIEAADGMGALALRFAILTAARSGEVRGADWSEIDIANRRWTVPATRMKAGRAHVVPLSDAALSVVEIVRAGRDQPEGLVFPSPRAGRPLSDMTLAAVLKRLDVPVTVHGFRSSFRTWASEETNYPRAVVETALSHSAAENAVEAAYLRSDLFNRRIALMTDWENELKRDRTSN